MVRLHSGPQDYGNRQIQYWVCKEFQEHSSLHAWQQHGHHQSQLRHCLPLHTDKWSKPPKTASCGLTNRSEDIPYQIEQ